MDTNAKLLRAGALALLAAGAWFMLARGGATPAPQAPPADPNYFAFVRSLEGTHPDGELHQDAADRLVVDAELAHLFDYYLAGLGEKPLAAIKVEIVRELDRRLRPIPAAQARRLLDSYLEYKRALVDVERALPPQATPLLGARARLAAMQQLRHDYFSAEEIAGLFGASDAYDDDALARMEINADATLTPEQRKQKLAELDRRLPATVREDREAPAKVLRVEEAVQQARAKGAGDNEVYRMRATAFSPEAAARLAELDREEADWARRIAQYKAERQQLGGSAAGSSAPDPAALQHLRDTLFSADEQKRLGAYE
jgi:lipase chaperone LimK